MLTAHRTTEVTTEVASVGERRRDDAKNFKNPETPKRASERKYVVHVRWQPATRNATNIVLSPIFLCFIM